MKRPFLNSIFAYSLTLAVVTAGSAQETPASGPTNDDRAAIGQAVAEQPGASSVALGSYNNEIGGTDDRGAVKGAFFRVCPFH